MPLLLLVSLQGFSQPVDGRIDPVAGVMQSIELYEGRSVSEIQEAVVQYIKLSYNDPRAVLVVEDSNYVRTREHVDVGAASVSCYAQTTYEVKQGKLRITISNYECIGTYGDFNGMRGMANKRGNVKMGYSAHHMWLITAMNRRSRQIRQLVEGERSVVEEDW